LTFYPDAIDEELAKPMDIAGGTELPGMDIVLKPQRLFRVRGRVSGSSADGLSVNAVFQPEAVAGERWTNAAFDPKTGAFEFSGLRPGKYQLSATADGIRGQTTLLVGERDVDGVEIKVGDTGELHASVLLDGQPWKPAARTSTALRLENTADDHIWNGGPEADGSFKFFELPSGSYRPFVYNPPSGSYMKAATYGEIDVLKNRLTWDSKSNATLTISLSSKPASLRGTVRNSALTPAPRAAVVLVPNRRDHRELYLTVVTNESGEFRFPSVPPGEYKVFAWEAIEQYAWMDAAVIAQFEDKGRVIRLEELEKGNIDVPLIPAESHP
jgi:hypothetical protein